MAPPPTIFTLRNSRVHGSSPDCGDILKHWLIRSLALHPLCTSQMSIQTMAMSDLGETLMILGLDAREMLSKMWFCFKTVSMSDDESFSQESA